VEGKSITPSSGKTVKDQAGAIPRNTLRLLDARLGNYMALVDSIKHLSLKSNPKILLL